jgi:predicted MPP superfamily phosphohydrolase
MPFGLLPMPILLRVFCAALYATAGLGLFLIFLNRTLIQMKDGRIKGLATLVTFIIVPLGAGLIGLSIGPSPWSMLPILLIVGIAVGEVRRIAIRRQFRGTQPVVDGGTRQSLRHFLTTTDLVVARYATTIDSWLGSRLRIAHLSDFHAGQNLPFSYFEHVIEKANEADPDLILLTGDFVATRWHASLLPGLLARLHSRYGIYATLGNHDYWAGAEEIAQMVSDAGAHLLRNAYHRIGIEGTAGVLLGGCEIPWNTNPWQPPPILPGELALALSHTPDNIYRLSDEGWHAVFGGHYHGGQIRLPVLGPLVVPSRYGRRFDQGHFVVRGTHLFVSAGVGTASTARIYCPPDIFIVDIKGRGIGIGDCPAVPIPNPHPPTMA